MGKKFRTFRVGYFTFKYQWDILRWKIYWGKALWTIRLVVCRLNNVLFIKLWMRLESRLWKGYSYSEMFYNERNRKIKTLLHFTVFLLHSKYYIYIYIILSWKNAFIGCKGVFKVFWLFYITVRSNIFK